MSGTPPGSLLHANAVAVKSRLFADKQNTARIAPTGDTIKKPPQAVVKEWSPQKIVLVLQYLTITIELILPLVMFDNLFLLVLQLL